MYYADARSLLEQCVNVGALSKHTDGGILIYREAGTHEPEGWYSEPIDELAKELMHDETGQHFLITELYKRGILFKQTYENLFKRSLP